MPKDKRLYMTFPIDFDEHPKVELLSDAAFRAFVAMNGYSRRQRLDGRIPAAIATKRWKPRVLDELVRSHGERPLVILDDDAYVLRSYAEHQFTTADEAELHEKKSRAGQMGGRPKAPAKPPALAPANQVPKQKEAGLEIGIETTTSKEVVRADKRGSRIPESFALTDSMRLWAMENTPLVNIDKCLPEFIDYWKGVAGEKGVKLDWEATWHNGMRKQQGFAERDRGPVPTTPKRRFVAHAD